MEAEAISQALKLCHGRIDEPDPHEAVLGLGLHVDDGRPVVGEVTPASTSRSVVARPMAPSAYERRLIGDDKS